MGNRERERGGYISIQLVHGVGLDGVDVEGGVGVHDGEASAGKDLLLLLSGEDLDDTGLELGNDGHVAGQDTHVTGSRGDVHLVDLGVSNHGLKK